MDMSCMVAETHVELNGELRIAAQHPLWKPVRSLPKRGEVTDFVLHENKALHDKSQLFDNFLRV